MSMIAKTALGDLENEVANTRRVLERYPEGKDDFTPHAKSWPMHKLANHVAGLVSWGAYTIATSVLDFAETTPPQPAAQNTAAGLVSIVDEAWAKFKAALESTTDEAMLETWTLRNGAHVIMSMPRIAVLRGVVVNHMIHHRAQLTIYYRLLDVPVPGLYGPSADETQ